MTPFEEEMLWNDLQTFQAWKTLNDPQAIEGANVEAYMKLCKAAGYSEEAAQKAGKEWGNVLLEKGRPL